MARHISKKIHIKKKLKTVFIFCLLLKSSTAKKNKKICDLEYTMDKQLDRDKRFRKLFDTLDKKGDSVLGTDDIKTLLEDRYQPFDNMEQVVDELMDTIRDNKSENSKVEDKSENKVYNKIDFNCFRSYMSRTEELLNNCFDTLDKDSNGKLDYKEIKEGFNDLNLGVDDDKIALFFETLDADDDGFISREEWTHNLMFIPGDKHHALQSAYMFFIDEMDMSSEGDVILSNETLQGVGYFLAGGLAGVVSRTCTAPFDRLKVYLIAQSGNPPEKQQSPPKTTEVVKDTLKQAAKGQKPTEQTNTIVSAVRHLWSKGGVRSFFVGNGLNVVKVFPESAMKFGSFEATKRFLCTIEGAADPTELSRAATFLSGGIGGMLSQFTIYPIDTLKFRVQCEAQYSSKRGNQLLIETATKMYQDNGFRGFYRGLWVGVCGIFPFAALDLGTFSAMKRAYLASQATKLECEQSEVELGNMIVLTMGALSGSVGASVVYPINLLRTRLQAQGTTAHPYTYTGLNDVFRKTIQRDGVKGLWRGLGPNLAKVAPAVSISYLVYENVKSTMNLQ